MSNYREDFKSVTAEEWNYHLEEAIKNSYTYVLGMTFTEATRYNKTKPRAMYIKVGKYKIYLTYPSFDGKHKTSIQFNFGMIEKDPHGQVSSASAYFYMSKRTGIKNIPDELYSDPNDKKTCCIGNLGGINYFNPNIKEGLYKAYEYDVNSAYAAACKQLMPIPETMEITHREVKEGEIGFSIDTPTGKEINGKVIYWEPIFYPSKIKCDFIFKADYNEKLISWAEELYEKKNQAKQEGNDSDKQKWKDYMNIAIGCLANHDPFIRNCIIYYSNKLIRDIILANIDSILVSVTDSIISLKKLDLNIGNDLGQFKEEFSNSEFVYKKSMNYEWSEANITVVRGIPADTYKAKGITPWIVTKDFKIERNPKYEI